MRRSALVLVLSLTAAQASAAPTPLKIEHILVPGGLGKSIDVVAEQALIKFSSNTSLSAANSALASVGVTRNQELPSIGWTLVDLPSGMHVADGLAMLLRLPGVENGQPNHVYKPSRVPSDPSVLTQSNLSQIDAYGAWDIAIGDQNKTTIAVLDTGIEGTHPDLVGKLDGTTGLVSKDCTCGAPCTNNSPPTHAAASNDNHATLVAGVAAATTNNGTGIAGISWGSQLVSVKVFDGVCAGGTDAAVSAAIDYAVTLQGTANAGKVVINMSLGANGLGACPGPCPGVNCYQATDTAINNAVVGAKVPVVVAAGNAAGAVEIPANCPGAIPVGSVNSLNIVSSFSSRGAELAANGVCAPGESIFSTNANGGYTAESGTSFSSPQVAGLAALMLSINTTLTPAQIQAFIRGGAENIGDSANNQGAGRINAFRSLRLASRGTLSDFDGDKKIISFPNPFRPATAGYSLVSFAFPPSIQGSNAVVRVYTTTGQLVRTITSLTWDGKNTNGTFVATGTYILEAKTDAGNLTGRMTVIR